VVQKEVPATQIPVEVNAYPDKQILQSPFAFTVLQKLGIFLQVLLEVR
jgi:hypothetical protein